MLRLDHLQRPELNKGTVDFAVSEEYWATSAPPRLSMIYHSLEPPVLGSSRPPEPMRYVFAFDVSADAVESGFLGAACSSLLTVLYGTTQEDGVVVPPCFPQDSPVAFVSYDRDLHFYNLSVRPFSSFSSDFGFSSLTRILFFWIARSAATAHDGASRS
jgi:protein transport protein SEC24